MDSFDPLETQSADGDLVARAKKREIGNILKSYTGWYDALSEMIQNALDAVEQRKQLPETRRTRGLALGKSLMLNC